jgi:hypothetical protein
MSIKPPINAWTLALLCVLSCLAPRAEPAPGRTVFDHLTTGFELVGEHRDLACESCHVNAIFRGTPHDCASCHGVGTAVRASARPQNHIQSSARCEACHTAAGWAPAVSFDHTEALGGCTTCHNNVQAQGKGPQHVVTSLACDACHSTIGWAGVAAMPANHIPTSAPCSQCHTTAGSYATYSVTGVHQGVTGCLTCHAPAVAASFANVTITTTPAGHIPIGSLDCNGAGCHSTTNVQAGGFLIGAASISAPTLNAAGHATVATAVAGCQSCHETAPYLGMTASTSTLAGDSRPSAALDSAHPASGDCNGCHTTSPTFGSNASGGTKPANHIPTTQACSLCHTTAGNFAAYVMGTTGHTGITSGCATCHASGLAFANMAPPTLVEPPPGPTGHIPVGTATCEQCHSTTNFSTFAGTVMIHAVVSGTACETCHEYGMTWKTNTGVQLWTRPSPNHNAGKDCGTAGCHSSRDRHALRPGTASPAGAAAVRTGTPTMAGTVAAAPGATVPAAAARPAAAAVGAGHPPLTGAACVSCHSAGAGLGKPPGHLLTTEACQACHSSLAWLPVIRVDHLHMRGSCVSCHDGLRAQRKPVMHIASGPQCESCHTTNGWTPARFEHSAAAPGSCRGCHDAVHASGMPVAHILTHESCDTCHGTLSWKPARMDHARVAGVACASCHNRISATGKPVTHIATPQDCAACHRYPDWKAGTNPPAVRPRPAPRMPERQHP